MLTDERQILWKTKNLVEQLQLLVAANGSRYDFCSALVGAAP